MTTKRTSRLKRDAVLVAAFSLLTIIVYFIPTGFKERSAKNSVRCRGRVVEVDNSHIIQSGIVKTGTQTLKVKILDGPHAGIEVQSFNELIGKMELDDGSAIRHFSSVESPVDMPHQPNLGP